MRSLALVSLLSWGAFALDWTATPFNPPSIPLAVRSPYLSTWLPQGSGAALNGAWPQFWTGSTLGWAGFIKVDGTAYSFLGDPAVSGSSFTKATQKSSKFTATQSVFVLSAGGIDLTATFMSPIEPDDFIKQSLPFSYLALSAASNDGNSHAVQVYSDISAEWVSGDNSLTANWTTTTGSILTHQVQLQSQSPYSEINDHIQHGSAYYSTSQANGVTYQTGADVTLRSKFIADGALANTQDTNFRAINDNWPVFAFAHDLGTVSAATAPVVISVGHLRDPAVEYIVAGGSLQPRSIYAWTQYSSAQDMIAAFLPDYSRALSAANDFDNKVQSDASAISSNYADIVALSLRQGFGAYEITVSRTGNGFNTSDVLTFQKEISSNGNMNTVDVIMPAWPGWLYTNPKLGVTVLEAILRYQASGLYPNAWCIHDIGAHYPQALGHNDGSDEAMPVEESGNMLMMALSYTQKSGDNSFISRYYNLLDQFTQFLITDSLIPGEQLSTDDFAGKLVNQTNLAIKGIVGIRAMAEIASIMGHDDVSANYSSIASDYVTRWQSLAMSTTEPHLTLNYNNEETWGLSYNLYGDKLLKLNLFPQSVYETQSAWYKTKTNAFGVPLDTRHTYTKSDWEIWTSTIVTDNTARDDFIDNVHDYVSNGANNIPFSDWYETTNGVSVGFRARPVAFGHLAHLVL